MNVSPAFYYPQIVAFWRPVFFFDFFNGCIIAPNKRLMLISLCPECALSLSQLPVYSSCFPLRCSIHRIYIEMLWSFRTQISRVFFVFRESAPYVHSYNFSARIAMVEGKYISFAGVASEAEFYSFEFWRYCVDANFIGPWYCSKIKFCVLRCEDHRTILCFNLFL